MWQEIIVFAVVGAAVAALFWRGRRKPAKAGVKPACSSCSGCRGGGCG